MSRSVRCYLPRGGPPRSPTPLFICPTSFFSGCNVLLPQLESHEQSLTVLSREAQYHVEAARRAMESSAFAVECELRIAFALVPGPRRRTDSFTLSEYI